MVRDSIAHMVVGPRKKDPYNSSTNIRLHDCIHNPLAMYNSCINEHFSMH